MNSYQARHVLVTGGCGFIGSHFLLQAHEAWREAQFVNVDILSYAADPAYLAPLADSARYHFYAYDICTVRHMVEVFVNHEIDTVVHFAAESHVDRSIASPLDFMLNNVLGTCVLLEAARDYWQNIRHFDDTQCRFHHISTDEVFGALAAGDPPFNEHTPYAPRSPYSASKASADHMVRAWANTYQLPVSISNCSNNYGPHQHQEKLIPTIIRACLRQEPIPIYGNGKNRRDWLYVADHCEAIMRIITQGRCGETYLIGGGYECSNVEIAERICAVMDELRPQGAPHARLIEYVADRAGHDFRYAIDDGKLRRELGFAPQHEFEQALRETVRWYVGRAA